MWGNITGVMGKALEKVQMIQSELESQMDAAVGAPQDETQAKIPQSASLERATAPTIAIVRSRDDIAEQNSSKTEMTTVDLSEKSVEPTDSTPTKAKKGPRAVKKAKGANGNAATVIIESSVAESAQNINYDSLDKGKELEHVDRQAAVIGELEAKHSKEVSLLLEKIVALELQTKQYNKQAFEAARSDWEREASAARALAAQEAATQKATLLEEMKTNSSTAEGQLAQLREEYDGRIASLQAELLAASLAQSSGAPSGTSQEDVLHAHLARKDEELAAKIAELKQVRGALQDSHAESSQALESLRAEMAQREEQMQAASFEKENLHAKSLTEANQLVESLRTEIAQREAQVQALTTEKEQMQASLQQAVATASASACASSSSAEQEEEKEEVARRLQELTAELSASRTSLQTAQAQVALKETELSSLLADMLKVKEALVERERALETATRNLSEQHRLNEGYAQKIHDLTAEIAEKDARSRQAQGSAAEEEENRKLVGKLQEQLREQGERLAAFEKEGQSLAKKQSEMEKVVRNSKKELRDKDTEIQKLKESKEQLVKAIEQTQDVLKKHESDASNASKSLSAMQAVSQASTDKLVRLEAELTAKSEEYASQRRALEAAWAETNELKRAISELKADRDDLRKRIGEGTSKVMETESSRRDIEQREAVLRATSKQLQDSLQRQMTESSAREERLREEVNEMRKRWQEAVASRESMASELGNATAPLLRQISSLQESVRVKGEHWQNIESSLSERALRAENAAEIAEHKRALMEEQLLEVKQQYASCNGRLAECQAQLSTAEALVERIRKREALWSEEKAELDSKFAMEVAQRQSLQATLREIELRHKVEVQELQDAAALVASQGELELSMAHKDLELLRDELAASKANGGGGGGSTPMKRAQSGSKLSLHGLHKAAAQNGSSSQDRFATHQMDGTGATSASESSDGGASYLANGAEHLVTSSLPSGEATFAASEKIQQRTRQRDDDLQALALQIQRLEAARNALLEEVSYLSMRNSQLEEQCASVPSLRAEVERCTKRTEMLLVLLGEKEEELEAVLGDMREVKHMYRAQLDALLEQCNPPLASAGATAEASSPPMQEVAL